MSRTRGDRARGSEFIRKGHSIVNKTAGLSLRIWSGVLCNLGVTLNICVWAPSCHLHLSLYVIGYVMTSWDCACAHYRSSAHLGNQPACTGTVINIDSIRCYWFVRFIGSTLCYCHAGNVGFYCKWKRLFSESYKSSACWMKVCWLLFDSSSGF